MYYIKTAEVTFRFELLINIILKIVDESRRLQIAVYFFFQDYTITMYLNQYWKDERLEYGKPDEQMTLTGDFADKIWVPDTFFANDKHSFLHKVTESNKMVRLSGDGSIAYGMRLVCHLTRKGRMKLCELRITGY